MNDFHFLRPHAFFLLIPFFLCIWLFLRNSRSTKIWEKICSKDLMPYVLTAKAKRNILPAVLIVTTLSLLITALAGPSWQQLSQPLIKSSSGLVIALDLSTTMNAEDIKPTRLQRAIYKINDLLTLRHEGQTALVVFSDEPFVVTPLTDDSATIKSLLPILETKLMPSDGHNVTKAIAQGIELLQRANISDGSILVVTAELSKSDMEKASKIALQHGVRISILGVGTEANTPIPKQEGGFKIDAKGALVITKLSKANLSQLASSTNGVYTSIASDESDINYLMKQSSAKQHDIPQDELELSHSKWHDQGYLLVLLALPLAALLFRRGILLALLFMVPHAIQAGFWDDLWYTKDQQAQHLFNEKEYGKAKELFQNPDWQATASYKEGDFETAANLFQQNSSADGLFNSGTAKAKSGDLQGALEAYDQTLEQQPDHADALYNKKIIEEFLQQEKQKKENNSDQKQDKNSKKDKQNKQDQSDSEDSNQENQSNEDETDQKDENSQQENQPKDSSEENEQDENEPAKESTPNDADSDKSPEEKNGADKLDEDQMKDLEKQYQDKIEKEKNEKNKEQPLKESTNESDVPPEEDLQRLNDERQLQRVVDDPGGLLKRKFLQQYRQNKSKKP